MLVVHTPPAKKIYSVDYTRHRIYLAGSQGDWRNHFIQRLENLLPIDVFNPDHPECDIEWEIDHISIANVIPFYLSTDSSSLLTLGLFAKTDRLIVCCEQSHPQKRNIDLLCQREDIHQVDSLDLLIEATIKRIAPNKSRKILDLI